MSEEELKSEKTAPAGNDQPENDWEKAWDNFKVDMNRFDQSEFEHPGGVQQDGDGRGRTITTKTVGTPGNKAIGTGTAGIKMPGIQMTGKITKTRPRKTRKKAACRILSAG